MEPSTIIVRASACRCSSGVSSTRPVMTCVRWTFLVTTTRSARVRTGSSNRMPRRRGFPTGSHSGSSASTRAGRSRPKRTTAQLAGLGGPGRRQLEPNQRLAQATGGLQANGLNVNNLSSNSQPPVSAEEPLPTPLRNPLHQPSVRPHCQNRQVVRTALKTWRELDAKSENPIISPP